MERVGQKIADGRVLSLIEAMLKAGVMEAATGWQPTESGTPQGAVISPLLSNIYLDPLDWLMAQSGYGSLRGWFEYYKHSKATAFESVDGYIRGRLRSILRRRTHRTGKGRGTDNQKWPNAYFTAMGLISLKQAHQAACRSL